MRWSVSLSAALPLSSIFTVADDRQRTTVAGVDRIALQSRNTKNFTHIMDVEMQKRGSG